jgi:hypothetical protein
MPENEAQVKIQITTEGDDKLSKTGTVLKDVNTSLGKQVPILKDLSPLLSTVGLGWVAGVSAVAAFGVAAKETNSIYESMLRSGVDYSTSLSVMTRNTISYTDSMKQAQTLSKLWNVDIQKVEASFSTLAQTIPDNATLFDMVNKAMKISHDTGLDLATVVKDLGAAYAGTSGMVDKFGVKVQPGPVGVETMTQKLMAGRSPEAAKSQVLDEMAMKSLQGAGAGIGSVFHWIKQIGEATLVSMLAPSTQAGNRLSNQAWSTLFNGSQTSSATSPQPVNLNLNLNLDGRQVYQGTINHMEDNRLLQGTP